jgi:HAE1 family hydrophobic/amphiphilic exporter-1
MFSKFFIERPIFATVVSLVIVIAGLVSFGALPVAQYPEISPPTVEVKTTYPGANAVVLAETVAAPIEQEVNGVVWTWPRCWCKTGLALPCPSCPMR